MSKEVLAKSVDGKGAFQRLSSVYRNWVKADGSTRFAPESGRYHLYVSYACPWASRTLMLRSLKGLKKAISVDVVDWLMTEKGWSFNPEVAGCTPDSVNGYSCLRQVYTEHGAENFNGKVTVPVLYDKKNKEIVNNESSEIIRMLSAEFNEFCETEEQRKLDLYPEHLRAGIDGVNEWIYTSINNGVYRAGFAQTQEAYDKAVHELFNALDRAEEILSKTRYLTGSEFTEADVRLFVTLIRFDMVYVQHFKCNRKRIIDYPSLWPYVRDIYQMPGVKETVNMEHIVKHYLKSHKHINPFGIVPINPILDFEEPHQRENI
ncbi:glutathionyl-hydroquinone reductase YqjG-like isoform X1 [Watersipora subatra]|uniref:glutathionyl-hydroquinone reductase YqjG-like isoform X1 n=1 Tax=Watersipora subatra TaxID=2589382 RepID=UPI00355BF7E8